MRPEYLRGVMRAAVSPRDRVRTFTVRGKPLRVRPPSFVAQYKEILLEREYDFQTNNSAPRILDIGANVGFSCLFFKSVYPDARIEAFEADPEIYSILQKNLADAGICDVEVHNQAVWVENTRLTFQANGLGGGRLSAEQGATSMSVDAIDLKGWLRNKTFDLIKMDIEGAENSVIPHCIEEIARSPRFIFEYHSTTGEQQRLGDLLTMLRDHGYRVYLKTCNPASSPLREIEQRRGPGFDNLLNVFAERLDDIAGEVGVRSRQGAE